MPWPTEPKKATSREARENALELVTTYYTKEYELWTKFINGGTIQCRSPGAANNLRQRMYRCRKNLHAANGPSPFDDLILKVKRGESDIIVAHRDDGIVELMPNEHIVAEIEEPIKPTVVETWPEDFLEEPKNHE